MLKILGLLFIPLFLFADTSVYWNNFFFSLDNSIITLPEYVATYLLSISLYFFTLLVLFQFILIAYRYLTTGFNMQQIRPLLFNFAITSLIVVLIVFTPGVKKSAYKEGGETKEIQTKLVVDMTSALLASGSRIADFFAYELLFGCIQCGNKQSIFTGAATYGPGRDQPLNGYLMNMITGNIFSIENKLKAKLEKVEPDMEKTLHTIGVILSKENLNTYKDMVDTIKKNIEIYNNSKIIHSLENKNNSTSNYSTFTLGDVTIQEMVTNDDSKKIFNTKVNNEINKFVKERIFNKTEQLKEKLKMDINDVTKLSLNSSGVNPLMGIEEKLDETMLAYKNTDFYNKLNIKLSDEQLNEFIKNDIPKSKLTENEGIFSNFDSKYIQLPLEKLAGNVKSITNQKNLYKHKMYPDLLNTFFDTIAQINSNDPQWPTEYDKSQILKKAEEALLSNQKDFEETKAAINKFNENIENFKNNPQNFKGITLNQLFKESSVINDLIVLPFIGQETIRDMLVEINLEEDYKFHWYDLGRFYAGVKKVIGKNVLQGSYMNTIVMDPNFNNESGNILINCLNQTNSTTKNNGCATQTFDNRAANASVSNNVLGFGFLGAIGSGGLSIKADSGKKMGTLEFMKGFAPAIMGVIFALLLLVMMSMLMNSLGPMVFWYIGVINWIFKSSIMLISFCFSIVFLVLDNRRQQVINNIFNLLGQAMIPAFMVGIFFSIVHMSIILDVIIYQAVPMAEILDKAKFTMTMGSLTVDEGDTFVKFLLSLIINGVISIVLFIMNFGLFRYLWQVDEFVSEAIGSQVQNTIISPDKVVRNFSFGADKFM